MMSSVPRSANMAMADITTWEAGHDLLDWIPAARRILFDPQIERVVRSMIGPYRWDECMHTHLNTSTDDGDWHQDDYCGKPWPTGRKFAIVCYYPQTVTADMGPTELWPDTLITGPAGMFIVMPTNTIHRPSGNKSGRPRVMFKFLAESEVHP